MAGKAWEGSHVLADVITNPMVGSWLRGSSTGTTVSEVSQSSQPLGFGFTYQHAMGRGSTQDPHCYWTNKSVIELGSGIGIVYITASLLGANPVVATDASQTSLRLVEQNADHAKALVHVQELCWGGENQGAHDRLLTSLTLANEKNSVPWSSIPPSSVSTKRFPDVILASDVVYLRSNRPGLRWTIDYLCGPHTIILLAHTWRTEPTADRAFFESFVDVSNGDRFDTKKGFELDEIPLHLLPEEYQRIGMYGLRPVSIFRLRRR